MIKIKTFGNFLSDKHAEQYHGLDDNMPDAFVDWLTNLDGLDYVNYAEQYAGEAKKQAIEEVIDIIKVWKKDLGSLQAKDGSYVNLTYLLGKIKKYDK